MFLVCVCPPNLATKPTPLAAIELIKASKVTTVTKRVVSCDGGGGALGHPKVYINLVCILCRPFLTFNSCACAG